MNGITLYNYFRSSTSYRVRIALELKGLSYNYYPVHLLNNGGEQNSEFYRQMNPAGGVPTLVHGKSVIAQSFAIIDYVDQLVKESPLFPGDISGAARVRQFCETINSDIHPLTNLKVMKFLQEKHAFTTEQKSAWINKWVGDGLEALERLLEPVSGEYCFGDSVTAADVFLIPQLFSANRFEVNFTKFKILNRVNENCLLLPEFLKAHPYRQPDTPSELRLSD